MANVHGRLAVVTLDGDPLTSYTKKVEFEEEAEAHDVTCFGKTNKVYASGLKDGKATLEGVYDSTIATSPAGIIRPLMGGADVPLVYQPEGVGTGKPTRTVDVIVTGYKESTPVDDMITWTADLQLSDSVTTTTQV